MVDPQDRRLALKLYFLSQRLKDQQELLDSLDDKERGILLDGYPHKIKDLFYYYAFLCLKMNEWAKDDAALYSIAMLRNFVLNQACKIFDDGRKKSGLQFMGFWPFWCHELAALRSADFEFVFLNQPIRHRSQAWLDFDSVWSEIIRVSWVDPFIAVPSPDIFLESPGRWQRGVVSLDLRTRKVYVRGIFQKQLSLRLFQVLKFFMAREEKKITIENFRLAFRDKNGVLPSKASLYQAMRRLRKILGPAARCLGTWSTSVRDRYYRFEGQPPPIQCWRGLFLLPESMFN